MELVLESNSPEDTQGFGQSLAPFLSTGDTIALHGDLGAGKTCFVQGLARGLNIPKETKITSPTFTLINEYYGGRVSLIHVDLYRLEKENELPNLGLDERLECGIGVVEWADKFRVLPADHILVSIDIVSDNQRQIVVKANGKKSQHIIETWRLK